MSEPDAGTQTVNADAAMEAVQAELAEARQTIEHLERRQKIDALLGGAEVMDLEAARLLTEQAVEQMDAPDLALAVEDLRRHRPYLFRRRGAEGPRGGSAMSPRVEEGPPPAIQAAQQARDSGDRGDLLTYLRLRRRA